jgi:hypothetical protein
VGFPKGDRRVTDIFAEMERDAVAFQKAPTTEESQDLTRLALELVEIDKRLARYAEVAKQLAERRTDLQMRVLVDAMDAVGQDRIGLGGEQGVDLVLSDYYKAGLPNPDNAKTDEERAEMASLRQEGVDWLTADEDGVNILTTTITVTLPKGSLERAQEIVGYLTSEQGAGIEEARVALEEGAHWATLTSFVKEQVREKGRSDLPLKALGATIGRIVKIVPRKKR